MNHTGRFDGLFKVFSIFLLSIIAIALLDIVINISVYKSITPVYAYLPSSEAEQSYNISIPSHESVILKHSENDTDMNITIYNPDEADCSLIVNYKN